MSFTYDPMGNPLSYYNGNNYTFTWLGRQLASATAGGKTYTYTYNDAGIRASKTVDGVTTTYYYDGNLLISEQTPTYTTLGVTSPAPIPLATADSTQAPIPLPTADITTITTCRRIIHSDAFDKFPYDIREYSLK